VTRVIRSRRAGVSRDQPFYARMLRLRHVAPSGFLCFVFLEGAVALGVLLALAELVSWWGVLVLPLTVAGMVKLNDVIAGMLARPAAPARRMPPPAVSEADRAPKLRPAAVPPEPAGDDHDRSLRGARTVDLQQRMTGGPLPDGAVDGGEGNGPPASRQWANRTDAFQQMARQSATRRYE
jgi:hypothetical protein